MYIVCVRACVRACTDVYGYTHRYICICDLGQHEYVDMHMQVHNIVEFHAAVTQMIVDDDALCWGDFGECVRE